MRRPANVSGSSQGAPTSSNGFVVPRPSETLGTDSSGSATARGYVPFGRVDSPGAAPQATGAAGCPPDQPMAQAGEYTVVGRNGAIVSAPTALRLE